MCGIAGFLDGSAIGTEERRRRAEAMGNSLTHRGPDGWGTWCDTDAGVAFVHRRLAIVDLSEAGHQPMISASGRFVIAFNGEIYNHVALRNELKAAGWQQGWQGHSDTETLLACIENYGFEAALSKLVGMFAIALFDRREQSLYLARDRIGEKPLYYGEQGGRHFFASELKAIKAHPEFEGVVDREAVCLFLRHNYIPAPYSIYVGIKKLLPGCWVKLEDGAKPQPYWSFDKVAHDAVANRLVCSEDEALELLDEQLGEAISLQMQADVPLGAFLSGGIDSSLIVAMMQERSRRKVRTFSIGFEDARFDEAPFAKAVASQIGTEHSELYVTGEQAREVIPKLPFLYDEPFSDSSQIPTHLVSAMARQHVTVSLSGDAGDELFGGYNRYNWGTSIWRGLRPVPKIVRQGVSGMVTAVSPAAWNTVFSPLMRALPPRYRQLNPGDRLHKAAGIFGADELLEIYLLLISHWKDPASIVRGAGEPEIIRDLMGAANELHRPADQMMYLDTLTYLPDDILVKVDRAAMAVSLETRVPFLDHRVVELAWKLPQNLKIRDGVGKWCLRQLLYRRVPPDLIERPKTGFGVPLESWLRNDLKDWAENLLDRARLEQAGYMDADPIRKKWEEHLSGVRNWHYYLWDILMFEAWRDNAGV